MLTPVQEVARICGRNSLPLTDLQLARLEEYVRLLIGWNAKINLISRKDTENIWTSHILHSLSMLFVMQIAEGSRLLDLGSGGGLPGIPLSIVRSDLRVVLLDSIVKKTVALSAMVEELRLENVGVVCGRAEEQGRRKEMSGVFDVVAARGVAPLEDLVKWGRRFLKPGGTSMLVAFKGGDLTAELSRARIRSGVGDVEVLPLVFPGLAGSELMEKKIIVVRIHA